MKTKNILITGGTGFLGVHLTRILLKQGYKVTLFDVADLTLCTLFATILLD